MNYMFRIHSDEQTGIHHLNGEHRKVAADLLIAILQVVIVLLLAVVTLVVVAEAPVLVVIPAVVEVAPVQVPRAVVAAVVADDK